MHTNDMTGEVTIDLAGKTFKLHATMPRLAEYQSRMGVVGLGALQRMIVSLDATAIYQGLRCLCTSGNEADLDTMLLTPHLEAANEAIIAALSAGLPEPSEKKAKAARG